MPADPDDPRGRRAGRPPDPAQRRAPLDGDDPRAADGPPARPDGRRPEAGRAGRAEAPIPSFALDWFLDRELQGYGSFIGRFAAAANLPLGQREAAEQAVLTDLEESWYVIARIVIPNVVEVRRSIDRATVTWNAARVLAAAQLHRLERGALPAGLPVLAPTLGELPVDPFDPTGANLRLVVRSDELRCYSIGEDGVDDGGQSEHGKPDIGLVCRLPAAD